MNSKQTINKSQALLAKIGAREVTSETSLLTDKGLLELFSWGSQRSPRARIKDTLAVLARQSDVSLGQIGTETLYKITDSGHQKLILIKLRQATTTHPATWNQRWHFVTYHTTDAHKSARNQFLIELKRIGFRNYAPSLWIYPYDVVKPVSKLAHHLGIGLSVDFLRADSIPQDARWRRTFHL